MAGVLAASYGNTKVQARLIPHASIYLADQPSGFIARYGASIGSALLSLVVAVAATLVAGAGMAQA
jgi:hypothetical protein